MVFRIKVRCTSASVQRCPWRTDCHLGIFMKRHGPAGRTNSKQIAAMDSHCHDNAMYGRKVALKDASIGPKCVAPSVAVLSQGLKRILRRTHGITGEVVTNDKRMSSVQVHWLGKSVTNGRIAYRRTPKEEIEIPDSGSRAPLLVPQDPGFGVVNSPGADTHSMDLCLEAVRSHRNDSCLFWLAASNKV